VTPLRLLSVASEAVPLVKTGGLADVVGALPAALTPHAVATTTLLPGYPAVLAAIGKAKCVHRWDALLGEPAQLLKASVAGRDLLVLDAPGYFARDGSPYSDASGTDWGDNWRRFAAFGRAAADIASGAASKLSFDILHAHDWQAAMAIIWRSRAGMQRRSLRGLPCPTAPSPLTGWKAMAASDF
jgi:starch synthase